MESLDGATSMRHFSIDLMMPISCNMRVLIVYIYKFNRIVTRNCGCHISVIQINIYYYTQIYLMANLRLHIEKNKNQIK